MNIDKRYVIGLVVLILVVAVAGIIGYQSFTTTPGGVYVSADLVENDSVNSSRIIEYNEMTDSQQKVFRSALESGDLVKVGEDTSYEIWIDNRFVSYNNSTYTVSVAVP